MSSSKEVHPTSGYTRIEEWMNSLTHGIGIALAIAALALTVVYASLSGRVYLIVASAVYGASMLALYTASTLYHSVRTLKWKRRFLVADHACIYLLIAGSYTPFTLGPLRGPMGWTLFGIVWGLAIAGVTRECIAKKRGGLWTSLIYLAMGWLVVGFIIPLYARLNSFEFSMLVSGGLIYSLGVVFYLWKSLKYHHAIWHLFVVGGSVCQFFSILSLVK